MRHTRPARIGIIGMGHAVYWPQFPGLEEDLEKKQKAFALCFSPESDLIDLGFADDVDSSFLALKRALASDLDALFIVMATYVPSAVAFPLIRYLRVPQILVGLQPLDRLDYGNCTTFMQLQNDDVCAMPEFSGVYERLGAPAPFFLVEAAGN
ncbi:MAG: arabinose isomerase, partial [Clostridia bacterium]|nr:arabinose isomerase [Clostridia bacterium]